MNSSQELGIYIHWPFCEKKCPYCDFNSHVQGNIDHLEWLKAYLNELRYYANETSDRVIKSVFFGGGTPSLMKTIIIEKILDEIQILWNLSKNVEITAEANPSSSESQLFKDFNLAGINRLSIGVQSFNNQSLKFLGRLHNADQAKNAITIARKIFPRFSFDLIYALPNQSAATWKKELLAAANIAGEHISLYQLTIEPGTEFYKKRITAANQIVGYDLYKLTQEIMDKAALPAYEISNHAKKGQESVHNLNYWQGGDYLGIGPGAHGRITKANKTEMMHNYRDPERWLNLASTKNTGGQKRSKLSNEERHDELVLMGLRLIKGISLDYYNSLTGKHLINILDQKKINFLINRGFLKLNKGFLKATIEGRQRLNAVLSYLLT
ncbi:MAG: radical SAM family heme chaperone HemW [Pseudomonadota bacterium]|nr:radical SAM family heme chaperone HemW [Pseudomonadota bacterium]